MRALLVLLLVSVAHAGVGPESTLVVVNKNSPLSRLVANDYVQLRDIPEGHVVYVDGIPHLGVIDLQLFLERIWKPVERRIAALGGRIRLVTYSADFPYGVRFKKGKADHQAIGTVASLNGLTYLIKHVEAGEEFYHLQINPYYGLTGPKAKRKVRRATSEERGLYMQAQQALQQKRYAEAAKAFEAFLKTYRDGPQPWYNYACCLARLGRGKEAVDALGKAVDAGWSNAGHTAEDPDLAPLRPLPGFRSVLARMGVGVQPVETFALDGYYLSTHLAYTGFRGNSLGEIRNYLKRSAQADGTFPEGTVYLMRNKNVRSTTREPFFRPLMDGLKARGRKVELLDGVLPPGKDDVIGAVIGTAKFDWAKAKSTLLPGAIVEHLTSFGAHFGTPGQTKCTPFLRAGASGTSGTVQEPLALHHKFPNPLIHLFYADGLSLAEAFYRSIHGPYQLMIIGDGLTRPFRKARAPQVKAPEGKWRGYVQLEVDPKDFEIWIDGKYLGDKLQIDTTKLADGHHEVRVVAADGYAKLAVVVDNFGLKVQDVLMEPAAGHTTNYRQDMQGAEELQLRQGDRVVARGNTGKLHFDPAPFAPGRFVLTPVWIFEGREAWRGRPQPFERKEDNTKITVKVESYVRFFPGLVGTVDGTKTVVTALPVKRARAMKLSGWLDVPAEGYMQLVATGSGTITLDGVEYTLPLFFGKWWAKGPFPLRFEHKGRNLAIHLNGTPVWSEPKFVHALDAHAKQPAVEGLTLSWKKTTSGVRGVVVLYKGDAKDWTIESTTSKRFRPVKNAETFQAPGYTRFDFKKKLRVRRLLLKAAGQPVIQEVVALR